MASSQRPRKQIHPCTEDRLTSLPKTAIDAILIRLPLREAVRTSILSRPWRYEWTNLSNLVFDTEELRPDYGMEIVNIVDHVLLLHQGRIHRFMLAVDLGNKFIDRWVIFMARNGTREFILHKLDGNEYKVHSSLFLCEQIVHLELDLCELMPPPWSNGFNTLKTLDLYSVKIPQNELEKLISSCPLLTKLILKYIVGCTHLKISAPNLVDLEVISEFEGLFFENTRVLANASILLLHQPMANGVIWSLIGFLCCLPGIRRLRWLDQSYKSLSTGKLPVICLSNCQLSFLSASINFEDRQQVLTALWLLRSAPLMREVHLKSIVNKNTENSPANAWDTLEAPNCSLNQLKILNLSECEGTKAELIFIEFVLAKAPVLEKLLIQCNQGFVDVTNFLKDLVRLRRISSSAEIVVP